MERAGRQLKALAERGPLGVPFSLRLGGVVAATLGLDTPRAGGQGDYLGREGVKGSPCLPGPSPGGAGEGETGNSGSQVPAAPAWEKDQVPFCSPSCCSPFLLGAEFVLPHPHPSCLPSALACDDPVWRARCWGPFSSFVRHYHVVLRKLLLLTGPQFALLYNGPLLSLSWGPEPWRSVSPGG